MDELMMALLANSSPSMGMGYRPDVQAKIDLLTSIGPGVDTSGGRTYDVSNGVHINPVSGLPFMNSQYHSAQAANSAAQQSVGRRQSMFEMGSPGMAALMMMGGTALGGGFANGGLGFGAGGAPTSVTAASPAATTGAGGSAAGGLAAKEAAKAAAAGGAGNAVKGAIPQVLEGVKDGLQGMNWQDWLGLGSTALGGMLQGKSEQNAAQMMNPWNLSGMFGSAAFDPASQSATMTADPMMAALRGQLGQQAGGMFGGGGANQFLNFAQGLGNNQIPGLFNDLQGALGNLPTDAFNSYQNQMGQAQGFANQDVSGLINNRLSLLREQAAPQEQQAQQDLEQRLFSQGRLGTTGGSRNIEAFARGLGQADLGRQLEAQNLGMQAQNQNLNQAGMLGNLAGSQFQNALNYNDIGANRASQRMQNAMGLFGFGNQLQDTQTRTGLAGLTGLLGIDQNMMNTLALGGNLRAPAGQAQLASSSPLGGLLSGLGQMSGLYDNN